MNEPAVVPATPEPTPRAARRNLKFAGLIYLLAIGAYAGTSGQRILRHSNDNHYVYLAYGWLHGRLDLGGPPPSSNDWAQVEWLHLKDGRTLKGAWLKGSRTQFRTLKRDVVTVRPDEIASKETRYYVSFPPFPGLLLLPFVLFAGMATNDVLFTVCLAALAPALLFLLLRRLRESGYSQRSLGDDLWLTAVLGFGSVFYFSAVRGEVWYTAHVVSVVCVALYALFAIEARKPFWAGLGLAGAFLSRPEILFTAPFFLFEVARVCSPPEPVPHVAHRPWRARLLGFWHRLDRRRAVRKLIAFSIPILVLGLAAAALNFLRFGRPTEFGHDYLNVLQRDQIDRYGLFNLVYLGRNLACAFALIPVFVAGPPWLKVSWHGLAMWVTTPVLLYLLWPKAKGPLHRALWIAIACVAIPDLLYQNSGWVQFGYRFSLDYLVFLMMLLAIGGRPFTKLFKVLALAGMAINLFGAITFYWAGQHYFNSYFPPGIN